jgi:hypothetical protein
MQDKNISDIQSIETETDYADKQVCTSGDNGDQTHAEEAYAQRQKTIVTAEIMEMGLGEIDEEIAQACEETGRGTA